MRFCFHANNGNIIESGNIVINEGDLFLSIAQGTSF